MESALQIHIDEILKTAAWQYTALWADIGTALMDRGLYHKALDVFAALTEDSDVSGHVALSCGPAD